MHCSEGCLQVRTTGPAVRKRAIYGANFAVAAFAGLRRGEIEGLEVARKNRLT